MDESRARPAAGPPGHQISEQTYRLLFEANPHPMWVYDLETLRFLAVNAAAVAHYGYTREEFLGQTIKEIRPPEDVPRLLENVAAVSAGLDQAGVWRHRKKDGTVIDVEIISHTLQFGGRAAELVLAHDVTERRRLREQFLHAQKMEAVGRLAGGIAHDFNNLLTAISGFSEIALASLPAAAPQRRLLAGVLEAAERAAALTGQLLAFSRKQVLQPRIVNLNDMLRGAERLLRRLLGEDIQITTRQEQDLWSVRADPGQLEQVVLNLAVNARDAMPEGGSLCLETANTVLDESFCRIHPRVQPGRYVMLSVSDTGRGLSAEAKAHLFEPFFTTKEVGKGTGLGLSTVHGIVTQSGGHIWASSEEGRGTTFRICLPECGETAGDAAAGEEEPRGGTETILVVEDDAAVREVLREALEALGYRVLVASGAAEALEKDRGHGSTIHLLLTDVVMPLVAGPELARQITRLRPACRVLFVSGYTPNAILHHGVLDAGVNYLQKPFTVRALARKVREVLDAGA